VHRRAAIVLGLAAAAMAAAGCGDDEESNVLDVRGVEYAFDMPSEGDGGVVTFNISNPGAELHEFALGRLAEGRDLADVRAYLKSDREGPPPWITDVGGVPLLSPGEEIGITRELEPGKYVYLCFIPTPQGVPHVKLGMVEDFDLEGDSGRDLPEPDAVVSATENGYEFGTIESGSQTIQLRNDDDREREFYLVALERGKDLRDVERFFEAGEPGEPPATFLGGMQTIPPGTSVYMDVELDAGVEYTLADASTGKEIVATFTPE
jgi:hypothetical protein